MQVNVPLQLELEESAERHQGDGQEGALPDSELQRG